MKKITALFLFPGPTYNARSQMYQAKFLALSPFVQGYLLTSGDNAENFQIGNFEFQSCARIGKLNNLKFIFFCLRKVLEIRKSGGVDCIITYDPLKTGLIGCLFKRILKAKLIVEVNGVYTSRIVWADRLKGVLNRIKFRFIPWLMHFVLSYADGIKILFKRQLHNFPDIMQNKKIAVFPNWIPIRFFKNHGEEHDVLFVGFPFYIKGVDVLIQAFKKISKKHPDWRLKILGWYPDKTELIQAIGGHPQICYHPPVSHSEVPVHIGKCGIFVLPSRTEAMGRVLLEAAAAGKPRIGSKVDGIPMVINDGIDGFLVESENITELADKMSTLMGDADLRAKIGSAAAVRARQEFSEQNYVENFVKFIHKIVCP